MYLLVWVSSDGRNHEDCLQTKRSEREAKGEGSQEVSDVDESVKSKPNDQKRVKYGDRKRYWTYKVATRLRTPASRRSNPNKTWLRATSTPARRPPRAGMVEALPRRPSSASVMS